MSSALRREQNRTTGTLLIPALAVIIIFTTVPALTTLSYAFFSWDGFQRSSFAGFENFQKLFAYPYLDQLLAALRHNTIAFVVIMTFQTSLGLLFAYAMFRVKRGLRFYRVVVFLPVIFSLVVVGYLWQSLLDPYYGPINQIITGIGLPEFAKPWLGDTSTALPTLMFINLWRWVGFPAIVFLAGLNAINSEYIEAARIDGVLIFTLVGLGAAFGSALLRRREVEQ